MFIQNNEEKENIVYCTPLKASRDPITPVFLSKFQVWAAQMRTSEYEKEKKNHWMQNVRNLSHRFGEMPRSDVENPNPMLAIKFLKRTEKMPIKSLVDWLR